MKTILIALSLIAVGGCLNSIIAAQICPTTPYTNTDCAFIITIGEGGTISIADVAGALSYDMGATGDDSLIGVINNSGADYTGNFMLAGTGNDGGIFNFDGTGICTYTGTTGTGAPGPTDYCATASTGYEGPLNTFSDISVDLTSGTVNIAGLVAGATTYFSLESSPGSIADAGGLSTAPEPASIALLGGALGVLGFVRRRRRG
jgi:hypothetical protein